MAAIADRAGLAVAGSPVDARGLPSDLDELASAMKLAVVAQVGQVEIAVSVLDDAVLLGASEAAFEPLMADTAAFLAAAASAPNAPAHPREAVQNP